MISGAHFIVYSKDAEADRAFLRDVVGLDSVDVVSIVSQIERRFRIRLSQQELEKLVTVDDVITLLEAKLTEAAQQSDNNNAAA